MEYTCLLKTKKGFITTRKPEQVFGELTIRFSGAPPNAHAIFENEKGETLYRLIENNACKIPAYYLAGEVTTTVAVLDGKSDAKKCYCEPFVAERMDNVLIVYPNWLDLHMQIIDIYSQIEEAKIGMENISNRQDLHEERLERIFDGYDFE